MEMALSNVCLSIFNGGLKYNTSPRGRSNKPFWRAFFIYFDSQDVFCCQKLLFLSLSFTSSMAFIKPKWRISPTF
mgnify:CR=1 FL=1